MPVFSGTAAADRIVGSAAADQIYGLDGDDLLYGGNGNDWLNGGLGADVMVGGLGDDLYLVGAAGDQVVERAGEGIDRVHAWVSHQLTANVETLILEGTAGLMGFGNALNNTITGNAGNNVLNGGAGNDTLIGGKGNDVYDVDSAGDRVQEAANEGYDRVRAGFSYTLGANLEELNLTGAAAVNGTGNALANTIVGNAAANVLTGGSGDDLLDGRAGNDRLVGGVGNDIYVVNAAGDQVVELAGQGTDRVRTSVSYTLGANLEELNLTGTWNVDGNGNSAANIITGNSGANSMEGYAGNDKIFGKAGNDRIYGGDGVDYLCGDEGNDTFIVDSENEIVSREVYDGGIGYDTFYIITDYNVIDMTNFTIRGVEKIDSVNTRLLFWVSQVSNISSIESDSIGFKSGGYIDFRALEYLAVGKISLSDYGNTLDLTGVVNPHDNLGTGVHIQGGGGRDVVQGPDSMASIDGGAGNDLLSAGSKGGSLRGGTGNDVLVGGAGADSLHGGTGKDHVSGGGGDDDLWIGGRVDSPQMDLSPGEIFDGGDGWDTLAVGDKYFVIDGIRASIDLSVIAFLNIENLVSIFSMTKLSASQDRSLSTIHANALEITDGGEIVFQNYGLAVSSVKLSDYGNSLSMPLYNLFSDLLVYGGLGSDVVTCGNVSNIVYGGGGNDTIAGGIGWDDLYGDSGDDVIRGGEGGDVIVGGKGTDLLTGGFGGDSFRFGKNEGVDTVSDFRSGIDGLWFENLLRGEFAYRGSAAFTSSGNSEARFVSGQVLVDTDGNGAVDIVIKLTGITSASQLQASDFVFV